MQVSQCTESGIFVCAIELEADPEEPGKWLVPQYAYCINPPKKIPAGCCAVINADCSGWDYPENHIGREGYVSGVPTRIELYGPLPDGWSDQPPPPDPLVVRQEEIRVALRRNDNNAIRPMRALRAAEGREDLTEEERTALREDEIILAYLDEESTALRTELRQVEAEIADKNSE